jgi:hypothetical protein
MVDAQNDDPLYRIIETAVQVGGARAGIEISGMRNHAAQ